MACIFYHIKTFSQVISVHSMFSVMMMLMVVMTVMMILFKSCPFPGFWSAGFVLLKGALCAHVIAIL